MILASTNKSKKVFKKYSGPWGKIRNRNEAMNLGKQIKYLKDLIRIKFYLDKILGIPSKIIVVGYVREKDNKYYPQIYLHECLYESVNEL